MNDCTWALDVRRADSGAFVFGLTFEAPRYTSRRDLAARACRYAAREYGGEPDDYLSTRPLRVPELD